MSDDRPVSRHSSGRATKEVRLHMHLRPPRLRRVSSSRVSVVDFEFSKCEIGVRMGRRPLALTLVMLVNAGVQFAVSERTNRVPHRVKMITEQNATKLMRYCSLNGVYRRTHRDEEGASCVCDSGWTGPTCAVLNLAPMQEQKQKQQHIPGVDLVR